MRASLAAVVGRRGAGARRRETVASLLAFALAIWFYGWTVRTEGGFAAPDRMDYYPALVNGWRSGHLYLDIAPDPRLMRLADPYDPAQNGPYRLPDASYYRGHYYLYFGAAPALTLMLPYAWLTGTGMSTATAVFVFCVLALTAGTTLWLVFRSRYFPGSAAWVAPAGVLVLAFGTHFLALARRPMWWELPIAAGVAFSLLALLALYAALHLSRPGWRVAAFGAAGLALGLGVGSRPTCLLGLAMFAPPLVQAWRDRGTAGATAWKGALAAAAALVACGLLIAWYNAARFGSPLEFGQKYQLSGMYEGKIRHFAPDFVPHNLGVYFFQPLHWTWDFPFVQEWTRGGTAAGYFNGEEMCGLFASFPFLAWALALPWAFVAVSGAGRAIVSAMALYFVGACILLLGFFSTTERYSAEFGPATALLALAGWLAIEARLRRFRWSWVGGAAAAAAAAVTVAIGVLVSFDYHGRVLMRDDPVLWRRLAGGAHAILTEVGMTLGQFPGARELKVRFASRPVGTVERFWEATDPRCPERVFIQHVSPSEIRFGYARGGQDPEWGRPLTWQPGHTHTIQLQLPSLHVPPTGWMRGLREHLEFRDRSAAVLWFSGGCALRVVAGPPPAGTVPGGAVSSEFSGEIRRVSTRRVLYLDDPLPGDQLASGAALPGGVLRLQVQLPDALALHGEPLLALGSRFGSDIVYLKPAASGAQVAIEHFGDPPVVSAPLVLAVNELHTVDIALPSCAVGSFGEDRNGTAIVRVDGREVLRRTGYFFAFAPGSEGIAQNPFGTTCARGFRGWVVQSKWVSETATR